MQASPPTSWASAAPIPSGAQALSRNDVELSLLMMLNVVEWFALEHAPGRDAGD